MLSWYAAICKPRQELIAQENLLRQGFNVYLPRIRTAKRRRGKWTDVVEALFPRYIFLQVDSQQHSTATVRSTRGAIDLVRFGGKPAIISDKIVAEIRQSEDQAMGSRQDNRPLFRAGDLVKLAEGPLMGLEGIFSQQDGEQRVLVLLNLLGRTSKVSIERDWVARAA